MVERFTPYKKTPDQMLFITRNLGIPDIHPLTRDKKWTLEFKEESPFASFGDPERPYAVVVSPLGEKVIGNLGNFLYRLESDEFYPNSTAPQDPLSLRGLRGLTVKTSIDKGRKKTPVYVKTLAPIIPSADITGVEQFVAMRLLEENSIRVANPIIATNWRIVTKLVKGLPVHFLYESLFKKYIQQLNELRSKLIRKGYWNEEWRIEEHPSNYLLTTRGFVAIDPVFKRSAILW